MAVGSYDRFAVPRVWRPTSIVEAWELRSKLGADSCYVSGGTLLRTQWEADVTPMPAHLISLEAISELKGIRCQSEAGVDIGSMLHVGALTNLEECRHHSGNVLLREACRHIAAPSIRNLGTIGGNIASRIGDAIPALLVQNAELVWFHGKGWIVVRLEDWLSSDENPASASEHAILSGIMMEASVDGGDNIFEDRKAFYHKVGRREAFVPSLVTVAGCMKVDEEGILQKVRLAVGGGASTAKRLIETEALLEGRRLTPPLMRQALISLNSEWNGFKDAFASAEYRQKAASNLIISELWKMFRLREASDT
ncbi:FAD binding domain-containing protein [Paenibacillus sp. UNC451MF]|uniref:FAD binding domain-containing protein n=1 Tax=Paenibacillus sp. UNC451MF TaxID=1449063 RepID=UPI00048C8C3A|nr:FAD binding domain-containing protein [Paenibacillus sp. UNC451MF]